MEGGYRTIALVPEQLMPQSKLSCFMCFMSDRTWSYRLGFLDPN